MKEESAAVQKPRPLAVRGRREEKYRWRPGNAKLMVMQNHFRQKCIVAVLTFVRGRVQYTVSQFVVDRG